MIVTVIMAVLGRMRSRGGNRKAFCDAHLLAALSASHRCRVFPLHAPRGRHYHNPQFPDVETEAQRGYTIAQCHTARACQSRDPSPGCLVQVHSSQSLGVAVPITPGARGPTLRRDTGQASKGVLISLQSPSPALEEGAKAERPSPCPSGSRWGQLCVPCRTPSQATQACCAGRQVRCPDAVVASPRSLFGGLQRERVQDADSVWRQQQAHQQHSCTLDECFQFYTKEEQVPRRVSARAGTGGSAPVRRGGAGGGRSRPGGCLSSWLRTTRGSVRTARPCSRAW